MSSSPPSSTAAPGTAAACPADDAAGSPDPYLPGHGTDAYRVTRYELGPGLQAQQQPAERPGGAARRARNARRPPIVLDLTGLRATKIQLDGRKVRKFSQRAEQLVVVPDAALLPGEHFTLEIRYEGNPPPRRGLWGEVGWEELTDGVLVAGQPNGAASWFPCNDHPRDKASYRISVTTDANYRAVCNGILVSHSCPVQPRDVGVRTGRADGHLPRHGPDRPLRTPGAQPGPPCSAGAPVRRRSGRRWRRTPASGWRRQPEMMRTFINCFGPYPFADYTVVVAEDELEIPLEAQSAVDLRPQPSARRTGSPSG